jgi:vitamin B12 transporter
MWFDGTYRNQITTRTLEFITYSGQFFNIGRTRSRGAELTADLAPIPGLRARAGYTFLASEIVAVDDTAPPGPPFDLGAWAFRRPRHSGFLDLAATIGNLSVDLSGVFSGRRTDSDFFALPVPVLESNLPAVWALGARYRVARQLELFLRIENLTNADYMDPLGYPAWERTGHGGLRVRF